MSRRKRIQVPLRIQSHQRKILLVAESPEKYVNDYSAEFQRDFMKLLSTRYGTRRVNANLVYQEFISDRTHLHMNATKWASLSEFTMHLGKEGLAIVDETPKGWLMQWIDNSPKTLARQEAIAKKERMEMDDEQREQKMIQEQIKAEALRKQSTQQQQDSGEDEDAAATTELVRENEEEKIKLDISIKPVGLSLGGPKLGGAGKGLLKPKSLNALAAKKPNPFSSPKGSSAAAPTAAPATPSGSATLSSATGTTPPTKKRSAVEEIIEKEMARKKRLAEMNSNGQSSSRPNFESSGRDREHDRERDYRDRDHRERDHRERDHRDRDHRDRDRDYRDRDRDRDRERERDRDRERRY
ncbi:unnamed protein product [Mortierella alpina]